MHGVPSWGHSVPCPEGTSCCFLPLVRSGGGERTQGTRELAQQLVFLDGERSLAGGAKGRDLGRSGD